MDYRELIKSIDDLEPQYRGIAEVIGLDDFCALCEKYAGASYHIPTTYAISRTARENDMKKDYRNGSTVNEICLKHRVSNATVYEALKK